jgi:threonine aldolase
MANKLAEGFAACGLTMLMPAETNQLFPILPHDLMHKLAEKYIFEVWEQLDDSHSAVRFCTAWSTSEKDVDALLEDLRAHTA